MNPRFRARKVLSICRQFGFDPKNFIVAILALPRFILDALKFRIPKGGKIDSLLPAVLDRRAESGSADGHYFWLWRAASNCARESAAEMPLHFKRSFSPKAMIFSAAISACFS